MVVLTTTKEILDALNAGITVTGVDIDIRDLSHTQDSIKIGDGVDFLAIDGNGKIGISDLPDVTLASQASPFTDDVKITLDGESVAVTGTFFQATQPVSGTFFQATQPISATDLDVLNEWKTLADNGTRRSGTASATSATSTLYTVPADKDFYITSLTLSWNNATSPTSASAILLVEADEILIMDTPDVSEVTGQISISPFPPIKITATDVIQVQSDDANMNAKGSFSGYEIAI